MCVRTCPVRQYVQTSQLPSVAYFMRPLRSNLWSCSDMESALKLMDSNNVAVKVQRTERQMEIDKLRAEIEVRMKRSAEPVGLAVASSSPALAPAGALALASTASPRIAPAASSNEAPEPPSTQNPETPLRHMLAQHSGHTAGLGDLASQEARLVETSREVRSTLAQKLTPQKIEKPAVPDVPAAAPSARCSGTVAKGSTKGQSPVPDGNTENNDGPARQSLAADNHEVPVGSVNVGKRGGKMVKHSDLSELNEKALLARLKRVCEVKDTGKCKVTDDVHKLWEGYDTTKRMDLARILAASDWDEATFDSRVSKTYLRKDETVKKFLKGWFTDTQMQKELGYADDYIACVKNYCKKNGLRQKTKYCKTTYEYWVEHQQRQEYTETRSKEESRTDMSQAQTEGVTNFELSDFEENKPPEVAEEADASESDSESTDDKKKNRGRNRNKKG